MRRPEFNGTRPFSSMSLLVQVVLLCYTSMTTRIKRDRVAVTTIQSLEWTSGFTNANSEVWGGGAVNLEYLRGTGVQIISCRFMSNWNGFKDDQKDESRLRGGGAIYLKDADATCEGCIFQDCIAKSGWGGAIVSLGEGKIPVLTIRDCEFSRCKCEHLDRVSETLTQFGGGGAICGLSTKTLVEQSHFTNCTCPCAKASQIHHGGAIMANHSLACTDCTFTSTKTVKGNGGAIWVSGQADSRVSGCKFTTCMGKNAGGVYYTGEAPFEISDCRFEQCSGQAADVACLYINTRALTFNNVTVLTNSSAKSLVSLVIPTTVDIDLVECHIDCTGSQGFDSGHQCINFGNSYGDISIRESSFVAVSKRGDGGGAFRFNGTGHTIEFLDCEFTRISAKNNGGAISFAGGHSEIVIIHGCTFDGCNANGTGGALYFSFTGESTGTCDIQNCTFTANTATGTEGNGQSLQLDFVATGPEPSMYVVRNCTFSEHTGSKWPLFLTPGEGYAQLQTPWELVELLFVKNTVGDGGLVGVWSAVDMSYVRCEFTANDCKEKGMVLLCRNRCGQRIFTECVFQQCSNVGSVGIMSVLFSEETGFVDELILESCEFNGCSGTSLLTFGKIGNVTINGTTFDSCSGTSSMVVCSNELQDPNVLFAIEDSHFVGCTGFAQLVSIEQSASIDLMHCRFETMKNGLSSIFMAQGELSVFRLEGCYFSDITITKSMIDFNSVRLCSDMEISNCQFSKCTSQTSFLHISSETLNISGNNVFAFAPDIMDVSPIKFELSGQGKIEGAEFSVLPWSTGRGYGKLVNLALSSPDAELEFYNCCFTQPSFTLTPETYPYFLVLSGEGKVKFTGACFECPQEAAFTKEGSVEVDCPAYSFETCECWVIPSFTDEPSQTDPQSSQVGPETTSDSESSSPVSPTTEDQGSGTGGKSNAGLIAGVTIAIIIIIVVIVIIVILLLRRRGQENSEEGVNSDEEFTEETIRTVTQEKAVPAPSGGWSQTTEDNPIFGTESVDNSTNPFANAFEEDAW